MYSPEQEVIADYWAGGKIRDIARNQAVPSRRVRQILIDAGGELPGSTVNNWSIYVAEQLSAEGASQKAIAETTGETVEWVRAWFPEASWGQGGGGEAAIIKSANEKMRRIDSNGHLAPKR